MAEGVVGDVGRFGEDVERVDVAERGVGYDVGYDVVVDWKLEQQRLAQDILYTWRESLVAGLSALIHVRNREEMRATY